MNICLAAFLFVTDFELKPVLFYLFELPFYCQAVVCQNFLIDLIWDNAPWILFRAA